MGELNKLGVSVKVIRTEEEYSEKKSLLVRVRGISINPLIVSCDEIQHMNDGLVDILKNGYNSILQSFKRDAPIGTSKI